MKALGIALLALSLSAGAANANLRPLLQAKALTPPTFRGSGFKPYERVTVRLRGASVPAVHVVTSGQGRFRARLAAVPACKAWTARAVGARGGVAVYHHARCASLNADVEGIVEQGPIMNTCSDQTPCKAPAPGITVQAYKAGSLVAETTTDDNGRFSLSLADGYYTIQPVGRGTKPQTVHVETASPAHLSFLIDTGIR